MNESDSQIRYMMSNKEGRKTLVRKMMKVGFTEKEAKESIKTVKEAMDFLRKYNN